MLKSYLTLEEMSLMCENNIKLSVVQKKDGLVFITMSLTSI